MKKWFGLILLSGCAAIPSSNGEELCRAMSQAWDDKATSCGEEATLPDPDVVCPRVHSVADSMEDDCLPWLRTMSCAELTNDHFQAHCGKALYLRTW